MRWAVSTKELLEKVKTRSERDKLSFQEFPDQQTLDNALKKEFGVWATYKFPAKFPSEAHYKRFQDRYEIFCGGYLFFYDEMVRNGAVDHTVRFRWAEQPKNGIYWVEMYLSPKPLAKITHDLKLKTAVVPKPSEGNKKASLNQVAAPPAVVEAVDPPKPPPPPPPYM
jgi:hypothetical protein